jgi:dihydrofolate synthase/folylpolyglutamate synthase
MATHSPLRDPELTAALDRLFSLQTFGIKLGLDPITALLAEIGNPHHRFPAIHIAGTNGKGSVSSMIASVLDAAGLRVGLYTSPHLVDFGERIRVGGVPIDDERLARYTREMLPVIERLSCTFFEGTTAIAFRHFAEESVDVAVIETGMGGRLDATNVLSPIACAITSIGYDHMKHLGDTLEKIAGEKAGIMKPGVPAVVGKVAPRLREIFERRGRELGAEVVLAERYCRSVYHAMTFEEITASFILDGREIPRVSIGLSGRHQIDNARTALSLIDRISARFGLSEAIIREGFRSVRRRTGLRGRFELLQRNPYTLLDVAHNPDGARVLVEALTSLTANGRSVRFVFGAVEDKDVDEIMKIFAPVARSLHAVRAENVRSLPADEIAARANAAGIPASVAGSVRDGVTAALAQAEPNEVVMICGSFYVAGEALAAGLPELADESEEEHRGPVDDAAGDAGYALAADRPARQTAERQAPVAGKRASVKEWNAGEQPRERLLELGARSLSDAELLAILLRTGTRGEDVVEVSRTILHRFGSLTALAARDARELQQVKGIGPTKAVTLAAAFELGRRVEIEPFSSRPRIEGPEDVANIYIPLLRDAQKERFYVLILNSANQVIRRELISEGNLNSSIVHPREVFRTAIVENAASIIGLHNHPSGNPTPSKEDINVTRQLVDTGRIIGIPFHDHVIIAGESYVSMRERGYIG